MVLSKVFMSALTTDESAGPTPPANQPSSQAIAKQKPATVKTADEEPLQITVQILVKDPEIVLLADAKDKDTNALFLKVSEGWVLKLTNAYVSFVKVHFHC